MLAVPIGSPAAMSRAFLGHDFERGVGAVRPSVSVLAMRGIAAYMAPRPFAMHNGQITLTGHSISVSMNLRVSSASAVPRAPSDGGLVCRKSPMRPRRGSSDTPSLPGWRVRFRVQLRWPRHAVGVRQPGSCWHRPRSPRRRRCLPHWSAEPRLRTACAADRCRENGRLFFGES